MSSSVETPTLTSASFEDLVREMIVRLGEDPTREGLTRTPNRVHRAYEYLVKGYKEDPEALLKKALFTVTYDEMVIVKDVEMFSLFGKGERGNDHLLQAEFLRVSRPLVQGFLQFLEPVVAAFANQACRVDSLSHLGGLQANQRSKTAVLVARRRAHFDGPEALRGKLPQRALEVLSDRLPHRPRLATDGQPERIGVEVRAAPRETPGRRYADSSFTNEPSS